MNEYVHECCRGDLRFRLTKDGRLLVANTKTGAEGVFPWYRDAKTGKPWMLKKAKGFKGLVAQADRDGEYDGLKKGG